MELNNKPNVRLIAHAGSDISVVNAARVSFDRAVAEMGVGDERLVKYLAEHDHHSPFNHSFLSFQVDASIMVARQLVKHKFMPFNEVSRRYVDGDVEYYMPEVWRTASENKKQGSGGPHENQDFITEVYLQSLERADEAYRTLIENGVAPEQARLVMPLGAMTKWYWSGTLGAVLDMLSLRVPEDAQKETRDVAAQIFNIVKDKFPVSTKAYLAAKGVSV